MKAFTRHLTSYKTLQYIGVGGKGATHVSLLPHKPVDQFTTRNPVTTPENETGVFAYSVMHYSTTDSPTTVQHNTTNKPLQLEIDGRDQEINFFLTWRQTENKKIGKNIYIVVFFTSSNSR